MGTKTALRQIADRIGLGEYPEELEAIYEKLKDSAQPACNLQEIAYLQEKYDLFAEFYDLVMLSAEKINADPDLNLYVRVAVQFNNGCDRMTALQLPAPTMSGRPELDFLMLHITIPRVEASFREMEKRGFSWGAQADAREAYSRAIRIVRQKTGHPGIDKGYFSWLGMYCRVGVFKTGGFWFEIKQLYPRALWIRNRQTGQLLPLIRGRFYRDGTMMLGAKNFEAPEAAFDAEFSEDAENFYGHECLENVVARNAAVYPKTQWDCAGRPGEYCLSIHVPPGTDISREATLDACRAGMQWMDRYFPEYTMTRVVFCASWLLNPRLKQLLGEQSRIVQFGECFVKYPIQDAGVGVLNFVFGKVPEDLTDLPENTSLQRKLKKLYLEGDCIHTYSGALYVEQ